MAASTILRVKRRLEENPQDAFVLTCKRAKTDVQDVSPSLFVFKGTISDQDSTQFKDLVAKESLKLKTASNIGDIIQKMREERKDVSNKHRYEIVKCSRGLKDSTEDIDENFHFVDLEKKDQASEESKYTYDLYVPAKEDFDISMLDELVSIENYESTLILGSYRENGQRSLSEEESSDDSNDENNWRNDYPEDEDSSINETDMIQAMERVDLDELSSDTGEDNIYDETESLNRDDVLRYGVAYAKYKARVQTEDVDLSNGKGLVHSNKLTTVKEHGYKDDSDDGFYYGEDEDTDHFKEQYKDNDKDDYDSD